jgi:hypothetical protein
LYLILVQGGDVLHRNALQVAVIPAKAGIQFVGGIFPKLCELDSRFRGNDRQHFHFKGHGIQNWFAEGT